MKRKVLVLHNLESLHRARRSALDYVTAFPRNAPDHEFHLRPVVWPVTENLKAQPWDAVIFTSTALGVVTFRPRELFLDLARSWAFLADHPACKIMFPQDDADHGELLDDWFEQMQADIVFTVRPERQSFIYPKASKRATFEQAYAGYLDTLTIETGRAFRRPFYERTVEIGQRVTLYPAHGGRLGRLKGEAALAVKAAANARGVREDISVDPENVFAGVDWYRFLGDCRFTVGAEGGLGVWDPRGEVMDRVDSYILSHPDAHFEEVEAACFAGLDGNPEFPGFSPRVLESALMGCCQILVEGDYRGLLRPWEHYIPLARDFSNMGEVFVAMKDRALVARLIENCERDLIASPTFRYETFVSRVMQVIDARGETRNDGSRISLESPVNALIERERSIGFKGSALASRVGDFIGAQAMAPHIEGSGLGAQVGEIAGRSVALALLASEYESGDATHRDDAVAATLRSRAQTAATLADLLDRSPPEPSSHNRVAGILRALWDQSAALFDFAAAGKSGALVRSVALMDAGSEAPSPERLAAAIRVVETIIADRPEAPFMTALGHSAPADLLEVLSLLVLPPAVRGAWYADDLDRLSAARKVLGAVAAGGDQGRLLTALAAAGPAVAGIVSRLLPAGAEYTPEELAWLEQVDRILIRSDRRTERLDALERHQQQPAPE